MDGWRDIIIRPYGMWLWPHNQPIHLTSQPIKWQHFKWYWRGRSMSFVSKPGSKETYLIIHYTIYFILNQNGKWKQCLGREAWCGWKESKHMMLFVSCFMGRSRSFYLWDAEGVGAHRDRCRWIGGVIALNSILLCDDWLNLLGSFCIISIELFICSLWRLYNHDNWK